MLYFSAQCCNNSQRDAIGWMSTLIYSTSSVEKGNFTNNDWWNSVYNVYDIVDGKPRPSRVKLILTPDQLAEFFLFSCLAPNLIDRVNANILM